MHAISVAQHMLNRHSDSVVRSLFSVQTLDKAVKDLESGFDDIVLTTDKLLNIANSLDARSRGVSDSEAEDTDDDNDDDSQGSRKGPKVIRWAKVINLIYLKNWNK